MIDRFALRVDLAEASIMTRFSQRDAVKTLSKVEHTKIQGVVQAIDLTELDFTSVLSAFLDHTFPINGRFAPVAQIYNRWKIFEQERLPFIRHLFPLTGGDEQILSVFLLDFKQPCSTIKMPKVYRFSPDFYRLLSVLRYYQDEEQQRLYPLFTLRSFLQAQIESLGKFLDQLIVGHLDSEKAHGRYAEYYMKTFYSQEMVNKARLRPSANNPVHNVSIRISYEQARMAQGLLVGDMTHPNEAPVVWANYPKIYEKNPKKDLTNGGKCGIVVGETTAVPTSMKD